MDFIEVIVTATGESTSVPRDWLDSPVLGKQFEKTVDQKIRDGELEPEKLPDPPTDKSTVKEIEAYAEKTGIDLGDAKNKDEKLAVVTTALAASTPGTVTPQVPFPNPDVQLVYGDVDTRPIIPALLQDQGDTPSSTETPATGDEEN